ncbi:facilitated trehalose transporter tret1-1-like protein [Holotrichia oblita]|uniref:Facilitated trehalose transporter tret1-1-like protein n=1 Tax=Holotrichia oblita TaxID=644536 RepID=A0ACB9SVN3_HOLOL|nr:facilitated trehalose transporter tret1-1-like protein [Holotrichia oblita]
MSQGGMGFEITQDQLSWVGSFTAVGAAFMAFIIGYISDKIGRKPTKLLLIIPMATGWALLAWAINVPMLYTGRILTGMSMGGFMVSNPVYINEITQKEIKGRLGSLTQLFISGGILFDVIAGKFASIKTYTLCCFAVPLIFGILFVFMPETPIYYLRKNKEDRAKITLKKLRSRDYDINAEMDQLKYILNEENRRNVYNKFKESWKMNRSTRLAFITSLMLMIFRVFSGVDAITAYTSLIISNAIDFDPSLGTIIVITIQTFIGVFQSIIIDHVGRKMLLFISQIIITLSLSVVGLCFLLKNQNLIIADRYSILDTLALISLCFYSVGFSLGIAPIPLILNAELNPPETKSLVSSFNTFLSWVLIFGVTKTFLLLEQAYGIEVAFLLYGGLSFLGVIFVILFVPETKGKSHQEIQKILEKYRFLSLSFR